MRPIYLDYAATTPVDPRVAEQMMRYLMPDGIFANPASTHLFGKTAKAAIDMARAQVAETIGADADEIIWTSGATEANNLALKGAAELYQRKGKHIVTVKTEHASVLDVCQVLEKRGFSVTYLSPEPNGLVDFDKLKAALRDDTILVSIMSVNNEIGVIQDLAAIANLTSSRNILLHTDAAQAVGKIVIDLKKIPIDLMSLSAHKVYGPKGIGALYVRKKPRVRVAAQIQGGGQEQGMRSGTLPTHQIVGMGEAFAFASHDFKADQQHIKKLHDYFCQFIANRPDISINGDMQYQVPHIVNVSFLNESSRELMARVPEVAISAGSACHAKGDEPSHVLRALGLDVTRARNSVRFSFGRFTTMEALERALRLI